MGSRGGHDHSAEGGAERTLSDRARGVLYAVVTEFIQTGEPVGSRTLSTRYSLDLSAATIRNVLKDLADAGYLQQPHTSAGRVPTLSAFRVFIDALMQVRRVSEHQRGQIEELFTQGLAPGELLLESGRLLSELSGLPAVVLRSAAETRSVQRIRFVPTRPGQLLSVVVLDDGSVENRFIAAPDAMDPRQLERLHHLLDEATSERTLTELKNHVGALASRERAELRAVSEMGEGLLEKALEGSLRRQEVIVSGSSRLVVPGADPGSLRRLMVALEDREQLAHLLDQTLESQDVQVFLGRGEQLGAEPSSPLSAVAAPYSARGNSPAGALGAVGPARMDYPGLVPLVQTMATALSRAFSEEDDESFPEKNKIAPDQH